MSRHNDDYPISASASRRLRQQQGQPRRRVVPWWRTRAAVFFAAATGIVSTGAAAAWLWQSGWLPAVAEHAKDRVIAASADLGLQVGEVLVTGRNETSRETLLAAVRLARGAPILGFDPDEVKGRVEALPWVRTASVQRLLPDTVIVHITERPPLALWQNEGRFSLIDHDGVVIRDADLGRFSDLLVVVGEDAPKHAADVIRLIGTQPALMPLVKSAVRVGGRRWNLQLTDGIEVQLPELDADAAWAQLAAYERDHKVLARDVQMLDLRLPGRLIVRRAAETGQRRPKAGQET